MNSKILIFFSVLLLVMMINVNSFALGKKLMYNGYYPEANNQVNEQNYPNGDKTLLPLTARSQLASIFLRLCTKVSNSTCEDSACIRRCQEELRNHANHIQAEKIKNFKNINTETTSK